MHHLSFWKLLDVLPAVCLASEMLGLSQTGGSTDLAIYTASALAAWKEKEGSK